MKKNVEHGMETGFTLGVDRVSAGFEKPKLQSGLPLVIIIDSTCN